MLRKSPLPVVLGLAVLVGLACEEFPEPLETDAGQIPVEIQPLDWPASLALGDATVLEVAVVDGNGARIQGVEVAWQLRQGSAGTLEPNGSDRLSRQLTGSALGWAHITLSLDQDPFVPTTRVDSVPVLLAGVRIVDPPNDTTLTALGQGLTLTARGLDVGGNPQVNTGIMWSLVSGASVSTTSAVQGDQINVQAEGEGTTVIAVGHPLCVGLTACTDTIEITVDQVPAGVDVTPARDTLVAGDQLQLSAAVVDGNGADAPNETVTWASRNTGVATVSASGQVTAQSAGQTFVVATAGSASDSASITVQASGELSVELTDAPADLLASADLFLSGVYVIDNLVSNGRRFLLDQPFSVDLLTLADTVTALAAGQVPAATYNDLILAVDSARITLMNPYTFPDATQSRTFTIAGDTLPVGITGAATVADGDTVRIVLDFDVDGSFPLPEPDVSNVVAGASFSPTTRTVNRTQAASISGAVTTASTPSVADVTLRAVRTDIAGDTVYTRTDAGGAFQFRYLIPGSYDLSVPRPPACHVANPAVLSQSVAAGQAATGAAFSFDPVAIDSVVSVAADTVNAIGFTTQLSATAYEGTTPLTGLDIEWSSLDPTVATVSRTGQVTGVASGDARIVAAACGSTDTTLVTVRQVAASVSISPENPQVEAGANQQFTATLADSGGTTIDTATFQWQSLNTDIADIESGTGLASALKSGTAIIEAYHAASGLFAQTEMNVLLASAQSFSLNRNGGCALTTTSQVACWGVVGSGMLGIAPSGTQDDWTVPYGPQTIPLPNATYTKVDVGVSHACALNNAGEIYCWGSGFDGELGNGSNFNSHTPVLVQNPGAAFTDVAAGNYHTCATNTSGQAYCWGQNDRGQLGDGTTNYHNLPAPVSQGGTFFEKVFAEDQTTCALTNTGAAECWGDGNQGELGNNSTSDAYTPVSVNMPVASFTELALSEDATCGLGSNGNAYCWGANYGGIIDPTYSMSEYPTPVQIGTETFVALGLSNTAMCGATGTGNVRCTGGNYYGQYGNGTTGWSDASRFEGGASGVSASMLDGGAWDTLCGLDASGDVYCWGIKGPGLTGTGDASETYSPIPTGVTGVIDLGTTAGRACALTDANQIYCWGIANSFVNTPESSNPNPTLAVAPPAGVVFQEMTLGEGHICGLTGTGQLYCLGWNAHGQLGNGTFNDSYGAWVPVSHPGGGAWDRITAGRAYTCALDFNSRIYCWGYNGDGALGHGPGTTGTDVATPTQVYDDGSGVAYTSVVAEAWHTCATTTNSRIYCWGWNQFGQLGTGDYNNRESPTEVASSTFFASVDVGDYNSCALDFTGNAYCWGESDNGEIGDNFNAVFPNTPTAVTGAGGTYSWIDVGASDYVCAQLNTGSLECWGANWTGQYAGPTSDVYGQPVAAWSGFSLSQLGSLGEAGCGVDASGTVYCTGFHGHGYTGAGLRGYEPLPVLVGGSGSN